MALRTKMNYYEQSQVAVAYLLLAFRTLLYVLVVSFCFRSCYWKLTRTFCGPNQFVLVILQFFRSVQSSSFTMMIRIASVSSRAPEVVGASLVSPNPIFSVTLTDGTVVPLYNAASDALFPSVVSLSLFELFFWMCKLEMIAFVAVVKGTVQNSALFQDVPLSISDTLSLSTYAASVNSTLGAQTLSIVVEVWNFLKPLIQLHLCDVLIIQRTQTSRRRLTENFVDIFFVLTAGSPQIALLTPAFFNGIRYNNVLSSQATVASVTCLITNASISSFFK